MNASSDNVRAALAFVPAHDRDLWLRMAMAVKSELGDDGFDLWDAWSQQAESYNKRDARHAWVSIEADGKVAIGTLFYEAGQRGYQPARDLRAPVVRAAKIDERECKRRANEAKKKRQRGAAVRKGTRIWKESAPLADHPYVARWLVWPVKTLREMNACEIKKILGYAPRQGGVALSGRLLIVPVKIDGVLSTLELIDEAGNKSALAGGTKQGGFWASQKLPDGDGKGLTLLIGEGVATVLSACQATEHPGVAALSSANLPAVTGQMRQRYPHARLVVLADLGPGEKEAHKAALAFGAFVAAPDFGNDRPKDAKDMNDLLLHRGAEAVRRVIATATASSTGEDQPDGKNAPARDSEHRNEADAVASPKNGVPGVTGVQASNDEGLGGTPSGDQGVPGLALAIPGDTERPAFIVFDDWQKHGGKKYRPGVWHFGIEAGKGHAPPVLTETRVCSPLHVNAVTFDGQDNNFGRLLRFKNTLGRWREWAMPMELLRAAGDELRGELLAMGVDIDPSAKTLLANYLQAKPPKRQIRCALQVGWCDDSFVLPDVVIGPKASGVIFQSGERGHDEHTMAGTLAGWKREIAARAIGNPLLTLAVSASFAGPMLGRCNAEGGGVHFIGDSSTGKTTLIEAACSSWGGPNFRRSWRATANGMEGAAALFNDCLLALDEISECDPREIGAIIYALGNGRGKQRASRSGSARGVTRWRCFILSSGERTIATAMQEGGYRAKAGQAVRLLDVPSSRTFGAWDDLHGAASGAAFSDAIKRAAVTHHGLAGRAFLDRLTRDGRDFCAMLERIKALPKFDADDGEGQDKRAAARFALLALAGEVATEYGLTGWAEGAAINAAAEGFEAWRGLRGRGNDERRQILERVSDFLERHGDARFSAADYIDQSQTRDRAGWWRDTNEGRTYLFTSEGIREAVKGFDFNRALDALQEAGALPPPEADGKRSRSQRFGGRKVRVYPIIADKLGGEHGT